MAAITFTEKGKVYESEWFQPNKPFQLDMKFATDGKNLVRIYSDNASGGSEPYALAGFKEYNHQQHINVPVLKVIPDAGVYYKVVCDLNPTSASYVTE